MVKRYGNDDMLTMSAAHELFRKLAALMPSGFPRLNGRAAIGGASPVETMGGGGGVCVRSLRQQPGAAPNAVDAVEGVLDHEAEGEGGAEALARIAEAFA
jgi:hypothetical protein